MSLMRIMSSTHKYFNPEYEEFKHQTYVGLTHFYRQNMVTFEWPSMRDEPEMYSPRLDIAVGPFATNRRFIQEYDDLMQASRNFIVQLIDFHIGNIRRFDNPNYDLSFDQLKSKNYNSRCLLAIEVENVTSPKYIIGSAVNASALGRVGIFIAWTPPKLKQYIKLRKYLEFLASVEKNTFDTTNLLILDRNQFLSALQIR